MYEIVHFSADIQVMPRLPMRDAIRELEKEILGCVPAEMPVAHFFAKGLYARSLTIPKHCVLTGAIHKHEHINILAKGDITVVTDDGPVRIQAPCVMVSKPGTKRAGFAHEECVWVTVHACDETEVDKAEAALVTNDYDEWLRLEQCHLQLPAQS